MIWQLLSDAESWTECGRMTAVTLFRCVAESYANVLITKVIMKLKRKYRTYKRISEEKKKTEKDLILASRIRSFFKKHCRNILG